MVKHNNVVPNVHLRKDWDKRVRTWFNQPARAARRAAARKVKAAGVFPRPVAGALRPIVQCPTQMHNGRNRLGRGFTLEELKKAGMSASTARAYGISVDYRRRNVSEGSLNTNVQRLKLYRSKLVLLPKHWGQTQAADKPVELRKKIKDAIAARKVRKGLKPHTKAAPVARDAVVQQSLALPFVQVPVVEAPRVPTDAEKKLHAYNVITKLRVKARGKKQSAEKEAK
jgi:ribosomal protein L13E